VSRPGFLRTSWSVAQASGRGGAVTAGDPVATALATAVGETVP